MDGELYLRYILHDFASKICTWFNVSILFTIGDDLYILDWDGRCNGKTFTKSLSHMQSEVFL